MARLLHLPAASTSLLRRLHLQPLRTAAAAAHAACAAEEEEEEDGHGRADRAAVVAADEDGGGLHKTHIVRVINQNTAFLKTYSDASNGRITDQ